MNLTYPAIISHEDDVFYIGFPDIEKNIKIKGKINFFILTSFQHSVKQLKIY